MGVQNGEVSELTQSVLVPPGVTTLLKYWYYISSPETNCTYDSALIQVNGTTVKTHPLCQTSHTTGWVQASVPLTAYGGQQVTLRFRVANDALSDPSVFMLDDVRLAIDPPCTVTTATDRDGNVDPHRHAVVQRQRRPPRWGPRRSTTTSSTCRQS